MKAIETEYAGCRFRSRLEARWAVFFDSLKIKWLYEAQGFEFDGKRYLPDFELPEQDLFVEVKGSDDALKESIPTLHRFCREGKKTLVILGEVPDAATDRFAPMHPMLHIIGDDLVTLGGVIVTGANGNRGFLGLMWNVPETTKPLPAGGLLPVPATVKAYRAARSARFEHGESGPAHRIRDARDAANPSERENTL